MNLAKIADFDSFRAYCWLLEMAEPDEVLWRYLRSRDIDLAHTFNMTADAMLAFYWRHGGEANAVGDLLWLMEEADA